MSLELISSALSEVISTNTTEVFCPVAQRKALVSPLTVADDINLRTMSARIQEQLKATARTLYKRSQFDPAFSDYNTFIQSLSFSDLEVLLWGLYKSTYKTVENHTLFCEKCGHQWTTSFDLDDILHDDSLVLWDKPAPFTSYVYNVPIKLKENMKLIFSLQYPTLARTFTIIDLTPAERVTQYLETLGTTATEYEFLLIITKGISLEKDGEVAGGVSTLDEIQVLLNQYLTSPMRETVLQAYEKEFSKYDPKFYLANITCPNCNNVANHSIPSMHTLFFFRLLNTGEETAVV